MKVFVMPSAKKFSVVIIGDLDAAREATGARTARPLFNTALNGYGNTHASLITDRDTLEQWMSESVGWPLQPGMLSFFTEA